MIHRKKKTKQESEVEEDHYAVKSINPKHNVFNRKLLRKAKRKGMKNADAVDGQKENKNLLNKITESKKKKANTKIKTVKKPKEEEEQAYKPEKWARDYHTKMLKEDEQEVADYEKKLGLKKTKGKDRFVKELKMDGIDDLYDFLDDISKKVHTEDYSYGNQMERMKQLGNNPLEPQLKSDDEQEQSDMDEELDSEDEEVGSVKSGEAVEEEVEPEGDDQDDVNEDPEEESDEELEDNDQEWEDVDQDLDAEELEGMEEGEDSEGWYDAEGNAVDPEQYFKEENQKTKAKDAKKVKKSANTDRPEVQVPPADSHTNGNQSHMPTVEEINQEIDPETRMEVEKALRACVNRVSEGNIDPIFSKMNEIYSLYPKGLVHQIYAELFMKACVDQPQCLHMIVAANSALLGAMYQIYDNPLLATFVKYITQRYRSVRDGKSEEQRVGDVQRNIFLSFSLMYKFNLFSAEFMLEIIVHLCENFSELNLEIITLVISNAGHKIRSDNPGILKRIIDFVREGFEKYQNKRQEQQGEGCSKKMEFLMMNLNDIKTNKKLPNDAKDRLEFLSNWLQRNVIKKMNLIPKTFPPKFADVLSNDFSNPRWYMPFNLDSMMSEKQQQEQKFQDILPQMTNKEYAKLEKLAVQLKFTTDIRKRVFIIIMSSNDYLEASHNLLKLKLHRKQMREVAVVIVQVCAQEEQFNKFYAYLAENIIRVDSNMKFSFQYALWDHFKQLESYPLRKVANLAKLLSFLINTKAMSLTSLRGIDIDVANEHQIILLKIVFKAFYSQSSLEQVKELFVRLNNNDELAMFRENIKDFIKKHVFKTEKAKVGEDDNEKEQLLAKIKSSLKSLQTF